MKILDNILFAGDIQDIAFTKGNFGGSGFGTYTDQDGNRVLETDILVARMGAHLNNLKVTDTEYMGGGFIFSSAGSEIVSVTDSDNSYRCLLKIKTGQNENRFQTGDGVFCQRYSNGTHRYYWRRVTAIGDDFIDLSKADCADGSDTPSAGDTIIQLGHLTDSKRQSAIYITTEGDSAPSFTMYGDIDGFTLSSKELSGHRFDTVSGEMFSYGYGSFFYGDHKSGHGIRYDRKKREFNISGNVTIGPGSSGLNNLSEWNDKQTQIDNALAKVGSAIQTADQARATLDEWASDNVISPLEKEGLRTELALINADYNDIEKNYIKYIQEFDKLILQDGKQYVTVDGFVFNVEVANTNWQAYRSAYNAYKGDLESKTANNDTVAIGTLKTTQLEYYNKRALILEDITLAIKAEADYATEQSRAAKSTADEAKTQASAVQREINSWLADGVISPVEKQGLRTTLTTTQAEYVEIYTELQRYDIDDETVSSYTSAYNTYVDRLENIISQQGVIPQGTVNDFIGEQETYFNFKLQVLDLISSEAKKNTDDAKQKAEEAKEEIADYEYLRGALGKSLSVEGVVMSQMVAVADNDDAESVTESDVVAFLNGSGVARDDEHGKLILAGGIPATTASGSPDLGARAVEAKTRIYENGRVDTNDIHATGGTFENVTVSGIFKNPFNDNGTFVSKSDNYVNLSSSSIRAISLPTDIEQSGRKVTFVGFFIITCSTNIIVEGKETDFYEISNEITELVAVKVSASQVQWHVLRRMPYGLNECSTVRHSGMFAGLRPKTRVITSTSSAQDRKLTELDHTIIVNDWTGNAVSLELPSNPQEGQKFDIYTTNGGTNLNVSFNHNKTAYNFITGNDLSSPISFTDGKRKHIEFFFCGQWWLNYRFLN